MGGLGLPWVRICGLVCGFWVVDENCCVLWVRIVMGFGDEKVCGFVDL